MLYYLDRLTEKLRRKVYGRLERDLFGQGETIGAQQTSINGGSKKSDRSMVSRSYEEKIPDPWFN